jgi:hypothetical protein
MDDSTRADAVRGLLHRPRCVLCGTHLRGHDDAACAAKMAAWAPEGIRQARMTVRPTPTPRFRTRPVTLPSCRDRTTPHA